MSDAAGTAGIEAPKDSIYTRLGGRPAVERAVTLFYDRVELDKRVNKFFPNTDMRRIRRKMV